ncbi:hypothetical protein Y032_0328g2634 [Ancylostoma ceylanicum]|uniref:Uncharacterized protein n=1 Tax=Ancylostoma ceylanicum TaxID=53326 RepID=A0A016RZL3_9BILA|nr:hypothetical protein Y032_0328g2634 [Ancylostoma ceylanicum]
MGRILYTTPAYSTSPERNFEDYSAERLLANIIKIYSTLEDVLSNFEKIIPLWNFGWLTGFWSGPPCSNLAIKVHSSKKYWTICVPT